METEGEKYGSQVSSNIYHFILLLLSKKNDMIRNFYLFI